MVIPPAAAFVATLHLTTVPLAAWCVLSSLEMLAIRHAYRPGRPLGIDVGALSAERTRSALFASPVCTPPAFLVFVLLRLAAGIALPFVSTMDAMLVLLVVVIGCTALVSIVARGSDGADKIALVVCAGGALIAAGGWTDDRWLCLAGLGWIAGQATIAYVTSGAAKLIRPFWRDGTALAAALTSNNAGHPIAAGIVRHRGVAIAASWGVMLAEVAFPLAFLSPMLAWPLVVALGLFHVATAVVMGLSTYPWAFAATYPAVVMASGIVATAIRGAG